MYKYLGLENPLIMCLEFLTKHARCAARVASLELHAQLEHIKENGFRQQVRDVPRISRLDFF